MGHDFDMGYDLDTELEKDYDMELDGDAEHAAAPRGGVPCGQRADPEVDKILKSATVEAAKKLAALLESDTDRTVIAVANSILDRAVGKARASGARDGDSEAVTPAIILARVRERRNG